MAIDRAIKYALVAVAIMTGVAIVITVTSGMHGSTPIGKDGVPLQSVPPYSNTAAPVFCTEEAKMCPDGTSVGRIPPSCEFAACPGVSSKPFHGSRGAGAQAFDSAEADLRINVPDTNESQDGYDTVMCTMDAKICPDGTTVGRSGPHCEFVCPEVQGASDENVVTGTVMVGPTCPVVQDANVDQCIDKPYTGTITLTSRDGRSYDITTNKDGVFKEALPPGTYTVSRDDSKNPFPICSGEMEVTESTKSVSISCDSGIR